MLPVSDISIVIVIFWPAAVAVMAAPFMVETAAELRRQALVDGDPGGATGGRDRSRRIERDGGGGGKCGDRRREGKQQSTHGVHSLAASPGL